MNGRELLEALSFIDEELLAASEMPRKESPRRHWAALAACLCILVLGAFSFRQMEKLAKTEAVADQCAPEAMMAMGAEQETYAAMEAAEEEPMEAGAPGDPAAQNSLADFDAVTSEEAPLRVQVMELTDSGFIARIIGEGGEIPTVTVFLTEDAISPTLEAGKEYYVTVASADADGCLWVSFVELAEE